MAVSLNDAFLVWYISEGTMRNKYQVTAITLMGRRTPNFDPGVFYRKVWSRDFLILLNVKCNQNTSFYASDEFMPNWRILTTMCLQYSTLNRFMKADVKTNKMVRPTVTHMHNLHNEKWLPLLTVLVTVDIIKSHLPRMIELPFCACIVLGHCTAPRAVFT